MGGGASRIDRPASLIKPHDHESLSEDQEYQEFLHLMSESTAERRGANGWTLKRGFRGPAFLANEGLDAEILVRRHRESGNPNFLLRATLRYRDCPDVRAHLECLLNPVQLPGLVELKDIDVREDAEGIRRTSPSPGETFVLPVIKYCRVKAPGCSARDHCWKYTVRKLEPTSSDNSGSESMKIFCCIRTCSHPDCPPDPDGKVIRAYYYNSTVMEVKCIDGVSVLEFTEFVHQDLGGGIPTGLMNWALPAGTMAANQEELRELVKRGEIRLAAA